MNKKIKRTSCALSGAAVLLVVVAGNVQAIPISPSRTPSLNVRAAQKASVHAAGLGNQIMTPINPVAVLVSGPQVAFPAGAVHAAAVERKRAGRVINYTPPAPPVITLAPPPIGAAVVADGGATLLMLGGAFSALLLVQRKLKAQPGL